MVGFGANNMSKEKVQLFLWEGLHWDVEYDINGNPIPFALCPKQRCNCSLVKSKETYSRGEYKYCCVRCDFKITLNKAVEEKGEDFLRILEAQKYKDAEIVNIDGELIRVQREQQTDSNYWVDVKLSKNKKGEVQVMVLAGDKSERSKSQLFVDPANERLAFDQHNDHPSKVFTKVTAIFKKSKAELESK